jgi:hypothetical protein
MLFLFGGCCFYGLGLLRFILRERERERERERADLGFCRR